MSLVVLLRLTQWCMYVLSNNCSIWMFSCWWLTLCSVRWQNTIAVIICRILYVRVTSQNYLLSASKTSPQIILLIFQKTGEHCLRLRWRTCSQWAWVQLSPVRHVRHCWRTQGYLLFPFGRVCFVLLVMRKGGRAVEVVPGIQFFHWKFSMCTATRTSSYSPVGPSVFLCIY